MARLAKIKCFDKSFFSFFQQNTHLLYNNICILLSIIIAVWKKQASTFNKSFLLSRRLNTIIIHYYGFYEGRKYLLNGNIVYFSHKLYTIQFFLKPFIDIFSTKITVQEIYSLSLPLWLVA